MGRYRPIIAALVQHSNLVSRHMSGKMPLGDGIEVTHQEWQVLEYIIEHENNDDRMIYISERLGIPQSSFSKMVKTLCSYGLCERYQMIGNKKNIILKPTEKGKDIYRVCSTGIKDGGFQSFFDALSGLDDAQIEQFALALNGLNKTLEAGLEKPNETTLIKLEK